jgi:hypothetical protein
MRLSRDESWWGLQELYGNLVTDHFGMLSAGGSIVNMAMLVSFQYGTKCRELWKLFRGWTLEIN